MNRKGALSLAIIFVLISISLLFIFAFANPFLMALDTDFFVAGEKIIKTIDVTKIQDLEVREAVNDSLHGSLDSIPEQITILSFTHKYAWVIILVVLTLIIFLFGRSQVERVNIR